MDLGLTFAGLLRTAAAIKSACFTEGCVLHRCSAVALMPPRISISWLFWFSLWSMFRHKLMSTCRSFRTVSGRTHQRCPEATTSLRFALSSRRSPRFPMGKRYHF